jgi:hypothetical protein
VNSQETVIVRGTGQFTPKLVAQSALGGSNITGFIDSNFGHHGKTINRTKVIAPELAGTASSDPERNPSLSRSDSLAHPCRSYARKSGHHPRVRILTSPANQYRQHL